MSYNSRWTLPVGLVSVPFSMAESQSIIKQYSEGHHSSAGRAAALCPWWSNADLSYKWDGWHAQVLPQRHYIYSFCRHTYLPPPLPPSTHSVKFECQFRPCLCAHAFRHTDCVSPDLHVLHKWMPGRDTSSMHYTWNWLGVRWLDHHKSPTSMVTPRLGAGQQGVKSKTSMNNFISLFLSTVDTHSTSRPSTAIWRPSLWA